MTGVYFLAFGMVLSLGACVPLDVLRLCANLEKQLDADLVKGGKVLRPFDCWVSMLDLL